MNKIFVWPLDFLLILGLMLHPSGKPPRPPGQGRTPLGRYPFLFPKTPMREIIWVRGAVPSR
jgi:hypothetical protein